MSKKGEGKKNDSLLLLFLVLFIIVLLLVFLFSTPSMIERAFDNQWELHELEREILLLEYSTLVGETSEGNGGQLSAPGSSSENTRIVELLHDFQNNPLITQMCKTDAEFRAMVNQTTARLAKYGLETGNTQELPLTYRSNSRKESANEVLTLVANLHQIESYLYEHGQHQIFTLQMSNIFIIMVILLLSAALLYIETRRRRESAIKESLRILNRRTLSEYEEARKEISYVIHDHVLQDLEMGRKLLREGRDQNNLEEVERTLAEGIRNLRSILDGLPVWDTSSLSFEDNVLMLCNKLAAMMEARLHVSVIGVARAALSLREMEQLLSILQEALYNTAKYAEASHVKVKALWARPQFRLIVEDDGVGFQPHRSKELDGRHLGLLGMEERARSIGASLHIESGSGKGTRITVVLERKSE
ncbi:MAG: ATP-binding protein [Spirochaetia bacterium]|nr:ATP-binding protein [Spirochaetia bacterium]